DLGNPLQISLLLGKLAKIDARLGNTDKASAEAAKAVDILDSVAIDAANVEPRRVRASAFSEIGDAYSLLARDTHTPPQSVKKLWTAARDMYERSLAILVDLRERGVLNADEFAEIDTITQKIAECDLFLAK